MAGSFGSPQIHTGEGSVCEMTHSGIRPPSSGSTSRLFPAPRFCHQSRWVAHDADVFSTEGGAIWDQEPQDSWDRNMDDGADIAEWIATSCILDESVAPASRTHSRFLPQTVLSQSGAIEQLSVRTKEGHSSPWLGASKGIGGSASVGSAEGSSSEISCEGSQEGSPTSVLGKAGSQAWDLLFAAAGEVQKIAQGQNADVQAKSTWSALAGSRTELRAAPAGDATWMRNGASRGLTAGTAAPACVNPVECETGRFLSGRPGWQQAPNVAGRMPIRGEKMPNVPVVHPAAANLRPCGAVTGRSPSSWLPAPRSVHVEPQYHRRPRSHCQSEMPAVQRMPQPQHLAPSPPPPGYPFNDYRPPRFGPMGPPPVEIGMRRPQFSPFGGLRGVNQDEPLHAVVLGNNKEQNSGTGVFLPRNANLGSSENSSGQHEEASGGHSTTVLLPARLIHSLGLNISAGNSVVVNRHPRVAPSPPGWHPTVPHNGQRRNFGPPMRMPCPVQQGTHFSALAPPAVYGGPHESAPVSDHSWEPPPAFGMQHGGPSGGASLYGNLPQEWAY